MTPGKQLAWQQIKAYKDTLIAISEPHSSSYVTNKCGRLSMSGKWDEAIRLLEDYYGQSAEDNSGQSENGVSSGRIVFGKTGYFAGKALSYSGFID